MKNTTNAAKTYEEMIEKLANVIDYNDRSTRNFTESSTFCSAVALAYGKLQEEVWCDAVDLVYAERDRADKIRDQATYSMEFA